MKLQAGSCKGGVSGNLDQFVRDKGRPAWCVKSEHEGSVKTGGFGFASFGR